MNTQPIAIKEDYLPFLDGLRGIAALWVIASHTLILTGAVRLPVVRRGDIAVDLFMIMSGFLMAYHYYVRQPKEPWERPKTWLQFYIRRFFRIAPLYYILFFVYFIYGPAMGEYREGIAQVYAGAKTDVSRFWDQSAMNIWMHLSFFFGWSPTYSYRTPMPDWSIGLEMAFYTVFPFLMLLMRGRYFLLSVGVLYTLSEVINGQFKSLFPMPSLLTISLKYFLIGMLLAVYNRYRKEGVKAWAAVAGALALGWLTHEKLILLIVILIVFMLNPSTIGRPVKLIADVLGSRAARWLADLSYCAYLLHLAFMTPIAYFCTQWPSYLAMPGRWRFLMVLALTLIPTYLMSLLCFYVIEKNGIIWGKKIVRQIA